MSPTHVPRAGFATKREPGPDPAGRAPLSSPSPRPPAAQPRPRQDRCSAAPAPARPGPRRYLAAAAELGVAAALPWRRFISGSDGGLHKAAAGSAGGGTQAAPVAGEGGGDGAPLRGRRDPRGGAGAARGRARLREGRAAGALPPSAALGPGRRRGAAPVSRSAAGCRRRQPAFPGRGEQRGKAAVFAPGNPRAGGGHEELREIRVAPVHPGTGGTDREWEAAPTLPPALPPPGKVITPGAWGQSGRVSWGHWPP